MKASRTQKTRSFSVTVKVALVPGATADDAEIAASDIGEHVLDVQASNRREASEAALDEFHSSVPIGVLDNVKITTRVSRG